MGALNYLDFDLQVERAGSGYRARVLNSPAGQATADFGLPFSDLELENFLLRMGRPPRGVRRLESSQLESAKGFGGKLFSALFQDEIRSLLRSSLDEAERQNLGLRLRLRLSGTPELSDLPWEYLYHSSLNRFLALSNETPLVRYLDLPEIIRPLRIAPPLRLLGLIPTPKDYEALDVEGEWSKLVEAVRDLEQQGLIVLERLDVVTLPALQRKLRQGEYHILHFVGHGGFDERAQDGVLVFDDGFGKGLPVSAQNLGTVLHDHRSLRLVVLNACEGARTSRIDPFAGVAQTLVQQRIPAVIAMQFEISDTAAIIFGHEFYAALADGYPVDAALAEARKSIFTQGGAVEWATPVLYMRAANGIIFDIQASSEADRTHLQVARQLTAARAAVAARDWKQAEEKARAILALEPTNPDAQAILAEVKEHAGREDESKALPASAPVRLAAPVTLPEQVTPRASGSPPPLTPARPGQAGSEAKNLPGSPQNKTTVRAAGAAGVIGLLLLVGCAFLALRGFGALTVLPTPTSAIGQSTPSGFSALAATTPTSTEFPSPTHAASTPTIEPATPTNTVQPISPTPLPTHTRLATSTPRPIPTNTPRPASSGLLVYGRVSGSDGVPIDGIDVAVIQGDTRFDADSGADGTFQQSVPRSGIWNVQIVGISCTTRIVDKNCQLSGYFDSKHNNVNVNVPQTEPVIFTYQRATAMLRGVVRDRTGQPVKNQRVDALRADGGWSWGGNSDESGAFALPVAGGTWEVYTISFNPTRAEGKHITVQVIDGQDTEPIALETP